MIKDTQKRLTTEQKQCEEEVCVVVLSIRRSAVLVGFSFFVMCVSLAHRVELWQTILSIFVENIGNPPSSLLLLVVLPCLHLFIAPVYCVFVVFLCCLVRCSTWTVLFSAD